MKYLISACFIFTILGHLAFAQGSPRAATPADSSLITLHNTIANLAKSLDSLRVESRYGLVLEKTNQQLSLWYNPYALIISSLAVLFTVLAIVATVIVFRQSAEYRRILDAAIAQYTQVLNKFIEDKKVQLDNIEQYFNRKIKEAEENLTTATGAQKKLIEDTIDKLKVERESVKSQIPSTTTAIPLSGSVFAFSQDRFHRCTKCGFGYIVKNPLGGLLGAAIYGGKTAAKCPNCGNVDETI